MIQADTFVGAFAVLLGLAVGMTALMPATTRFQLGIAQSISKRCGDLASRAVVGIIATMLLIAGVMILRDYRPSFANPSGNNAGSERSGSDAISR